MAILAPFLKLSYGVGVALARAFSRRAVRRFVLPIIVWEGSKAMLEYAAFVLKVRSANFFLSSLGEEAELSLMLAHSGWTRDQIDAWSTEQMEAAVDLYFLERTIATGRDKLGRRIEQLRGGIA